MRARNVRGEPPRAVHEGCVRHRGGTSAARVGALAALLVLFGSRSVAAREPGSGVLRQPIIYGQDDRRDVYQVSDAGLRDRARRAVAAFVLSQQLIYEADGGVRLVSPTLQETYEVCAGERFADQPSAAFCSGVLLEQELVATAGHCLGHDEEDRARACDRLALVFGYLYEREGELGPLVPDSIYRCQRVVAFSKSPARADFAVIQLDRAAGVPLAPAPLASGGPELGAPVHVIGFGAGLPAKVDGGGVISDVLGDWFGASTDTFAGSSGSPVFNESTELLGLHVQGGRDWDIGPSCRQSASADEGTEWHQSIHSVVSALCASGWPSAALCGVEPACGDGYCSHGELPESCDLDCKAPRCGDGRCERAEPLTCGVDCPSFVPAPPEWTCPPSYYGDRAGCDCGCGAADIDCDDPTEPVLDCAQDFSCDSGGRCVAPEPDGCSVGGGRPAWRVPSSFAVAVSLLLAVALAARARYH